MPYNVPYRGLLTEYYTLDYARAFDALQLRIAVMRNSLKVTGEWTAGLYSILSLS